MRGDRERRYATCMELVTGYERVLLAIVSDGAGSAEFSSIGSRLVVECFARCVVSQLRTGQPLEEITEELVREWLDNVRDHIFRSASQRATKPRQMAATLIGAIVCPTRAIVSHVGDGACVLRRKGSSLWEVPSWPAHGEYASLPTSLRMTQNQIFILFRSMVSFPKLPYSPMELKGLRSTFSIRVHLMGFSILCLRHSQNWLPVAIADYLRVYDNISIVPVLPNVQTMINHSC